MEAPDGRRAGRSAPGAPVRPGRPVTVEDVAAEAGVSVATVSRALRGLPNVAPATRARVVAAARELRYQPNPNASRLAAGRTHCIGVAMPMIGQWYYSQVLAGAEAVLAPAGYDLLVYTAVGPDDARRFLGDALPLRKRVDGLVVVDLALGDAELEDGASRGACMVTVGQHTDVFSSVGIDDRAAARLAVNHLLDLGHRGIAFLGVHPEEDPFRFPVPGRRRDGYAEALTDVGRSPRPDHVISAGFSIESGRTAMDRLLATVDPPTAVLANSDELAFGALHSIRRHGLRVPEDVSVVGFDDHEVAESIGLTTIRQPVTDLGGRAARLVLDQLESGPGAPVHEELPTSLVVRSSTCPPRG
jgi:LacI family transcriptional regulator, repressor for deo operon, udp, cdd, tsx, nupC, and nupG